MRTIILFLILFLTHSSPAETSNIKNCEECKCVNEYDKSLDSIRATLPQGERYGCSPNIYKCKNPNGIPIQTYTFAKCEVVLGANGNVTCEKKEYSKNISCEELDTTSFLCEHMGDEPTFVNGVASGYYNDYSPENITCELTYQLIFDKNTPFCNAKLINSSKRALMGAKKCLLGDIKKAGHAGYESMNSCSHADSTIKENGHCLGSCSLRRMIPGPEAQKCILDPALKHDKDHQFECKHK